MSDDAQMFNANEMLNSFLGLTQEQAAEREKEFLTRSEQIRRDLHALQVANNVPLKVDTPPFLFQEYGDFFDIDELRPSDRRQDMYAFFAANDPTVTLNATIQIKGVRFDDLSYRQLSPVTDDMLDTAEVASVKQYTQEITDVVTAANGKVWSSKQDGSLFYLRVTGNAQVFCALDQLEGVDAIALIGDPSNLKQERAAARKVVQAARWARLTQG